MFALKDRPCRAAAEAKRSCLIIERRVPGPDKGILNLLYLGPLACLRRQPRISSFVFVGHAHCIALSKELGSKPPYELCRKGYRGTGMQLCDMAHASRAPYEVAVALCCSGLCR